VIIGAGTTAHAAIEAIRMHDPDSKVLLISSEKAIPSRKNGLRHKSVRLGDDFLSSYNEWRRHITSKLASETDVFRYQSSEGGGVDFLLNVNTPVIDKDNSVLSVESNARQPHAQHTQHTQRIKYNKCLIATAGNPRAFYVLGNDTKNGTSVNSLQTIDDFERLECVIDEITSASNNTATNSRTVAVIGGGFLGTEIALGLAKRVRDNKTSKPDSPHVTVLHIYAERAPLCEYLPRYLAEDVKSRLIRHGVTAVTDRLVTDMAVVEVDSDSNSSSNNSNNNNHNNHNNHSNNHNNNNDTDTGVDGCDREIVRMNLVGAKRGKVEADYVVMASSTINPNVAIATKSGLELDQVNGGIVVNDQLEVGNGVYAAGVVASYYDPVLGRRRVNRYDHSVNTGLLAGFNMVSSNPKRGSLSRNGLGEHEDYHEDSECVQVGYTHQPAVRSYLKDINVSCESIGECDSKLETYGAWIRGNPEDENPQSNTNAFMDDVSGMSPYKRGVVYYVKNGKVVGVVLWNASDLIERARDVIRLYPTVKNLAKLKNKIPLAPDDWLKVIHVRAKGDKTNSQDEEEREREREREAMLFRVESRKVE
jgi:programmed cell death 8 (apoptosis-inducing factor)